jgi:hypothetical protein
MAAGDHEGNVAAKIPVECMMDMMECKIKLEDIDDSDIKDMMDLVAADAPPLALTAAVDP